MSHSLHVPAHVMQRVTRVLNWISPLMGMAMLTGLGFGQRWLSSRASHEYVGDKVAEPIGIARKAQDDAHHAASIADGHTIELRAVWGHVIAMRAEQEVQRRYPRQDAGTRGQYIELAQRFYAHEYALQLEKTISPAEAARLALLADWRPPR
jgi:hypothetical protein